MNTIQFKCIMLGVNMVFLVAAYLTTGYLIAIVFLTQTLYHKLSGHIRSF